MRGWALNARMHVACKIVQNGVSYLNTSQYHQSGWRHNWGVFAVRKAFIFRKCDEILSKNFTKCLIGQYLEYPVPRGKKYFCVPLFPPPNKNCYVVKWKIYAKAQKQKQNIRHWVKFVWKLIDYLPIYHWHFVHKLT